MSKNKRNSYELRRRLGDQGLRQSVPCQAGLDDKSATDNTSNTSSRNSSRRGWSGRKKKEQHQTNASSLNILQLNIDGMSVKSGKKEQLAKILSDRKIHVALIQESQHRAIDPNITGYTTYQCNCNTNCRGVITYVRNDTTADVQNLITPEEPTHVQKVTIWEDNRKFTVYNIYSPPGTTCTIEDLQDTIYRNTIVAGDFNAHSPLWGYDDTNSSGKYVEEINETTNLILQQDCDSIPTLLHKASSTLSKPDLTFVSSDLDPLYTVLQGMGSDHRPIMINLPKARRQQQDQRLRWNFQKAKWDDYTQQIEKELRDLNLDNENNPDILDEKITAAIMESSKKHIPRGKIQAFLE